MRFRLSRASLSLFLSSEDYVTGSLQQGCGSVVRHRGDGWRPFRLGAVSRPRGHRYGRRRYSPPRHRHRGIYRRSRRHEGQPPHSHRRMGRHAVPAREPSTSRSPRPWPCFPAPNTNWKQTAGPKASSISGILRAWPVCGSAWATTRRPKVLKAKLQPAKVMPYVVRDVDPGQAALRAPSR